LQKSLKIEAGNSYRQSQHIVFGQNLKDFEGESKLQYEQDFGKEKEKIFCIVIFIE